MKSQVVKSIKFKVPWLNDTKIYMTVQTVIVCIIWLVSKYLANILLHYHFKSMFVGVDLLVF